MIDKWKQIIMDSKKYVNFFLCVYKSGVCTVYVLRILRVGNLGYFGQIKISSAVRP